MLTVIEHQNNAKQLSKATNLSFPSITFLVYGSLPINRIMVENVNYLNAFL